MAERPTEFSYRDIQLYKSESLGSGSYGGVCKAKCDGLLCAAKIIHPTLFDLRDPGTVSYLRKFREECHLLSLARHPNVVQYLGTYYDPDIRLPVLLMELCDESLTGFLERSPGPLSYHIQVNICHDIALALVYLHSNGLIHRDLTGNNILMIAGPRAKITDFGMSKLVSINPRMTALTLCPGNRLYMPPEALDEATSYTAKLDIFSFGVLIIQILTREFPNPTDRFRNIHIPGIIKEVKEIVPETERRKSHLQLIPDTHSLKLLALQCLKKENGRPSALQLIERLFELKTSCQYTKSMHDAQESSRVRQLLLQEQRTQLTELEKIANEKDTQILEQQQIIQHNRRQLMEKDRQLQRALATKDHVLERKERELQQTQRLVSEFQDGLQQKDKTITELQQTVAEHKRKIQQLEQQDTAASIDHQPYIGRMKWRDEKNAPEAMLRGAAVGHRNTAYFRPASSNRVYSYKEGKWCRLMNNPTTDFGLTVIGGFITSVGGRTEYPTNVLISLKKEAEWRFWSEIFPPMPTPRANPACVTTEQTLIVAGGDGDDDEYKNTVEAFNATTSKWSTVSPLPEYLSSLSATLCGDKLYVAGGMHNHYFTKSVFTCSLSNLLSFGSMLLPRSCNVWMEIRHLPVTGSTLATFSGNLLAIGGRYASGNPTSEVYRYDSHTDSWIVAGEMNHKRYKCLATNLAEEALIVVGGYGQSETANVEVLDKTCYF